MKIQSTIKLESFSNICLQKVTNNIMNHAQNLEFAKFIDINLKKKQKKFTLLKSPHVYKTSREQFELITYKKLIILSGTSKQNNDLIELLKVNGNKFNNVKYILKLKKVNNFN